MLLNLSRLIGRYVLPWDALNGFYPRLLTPTHARLLESGGKPAIKDFANTDFRQTLWLAPRDAIDQNDLPQPAAQCTARLQLGTGTHTPTSLTIDTRADAPGWLALGDPDLPGWQASADGVVLPIHRANGMFRAVCVPAGKHVVQFTFRHLLMIAEARKLAPL